MFKNDFIERQMQIMSLCLGKTFLNKEQIVYEITDPYRNVASNELYKRLMEMLMDGKINEAENLLFEAVEQEKVDQEDAIHVAFDFYLKVNQYNDDYLELCNYSRAEADAGWVDITKYLEI